MLYAGAAQAKMPSSRGPGARTKRWLLSKIRSILEKGLLLGINEEKSKVVDVEKEAVRFLGFEIRLVRSRGRKFALMYPSKKAMRG